MNEFKINYNKNKKHIVYNDCIILHAQSSPPLSSEVENEHMETHKNISVSDDVGQNDLLLSVNFNDSVNIRQRQLGDELKDFFMRPVNIFTYEWEPRAVTPFSSFRIFPWSRYLTNGVVRSKLDNFKLVHGTLKLKFLINGTPYYYGKLMVGVYPYDDSNYTYPLLPEVPLGTFNYLTNTGSSVPFQRPALSFFSQRPHILLSPNKNESASISWPFFSLFDWLDVTDSSGVIAANSNMYRKMGSLEFNELAPLQHLNGSPLPVVITVMAWMEDVEVAGITTLAAQSSKVETKNYSGSRKNKTIPTSSTVKLSPMMESSSVPLNHDTEILGFGKRVNLPTNSFITQNYFGNFANWSGNEALVKLSVDPKQEVTIDPTTLGLQSNDEMSFMDIAKRETLIFTTQWNPTNDTSGFNLMRMVVNPLVAPRNGNTTEPDRPAANWNTSLSFIANPFKYWTGSLRYRIQIVSSQFHNGRLLFSYDPSVTSTGPPNFNNRFSHIIDICQENDITFEINWSQPDAFKLVERSDIVDLRTGPAIAFPANNARSCNGVIQLSVLNNLVSNGNTDNVYILVWISAGDSFRVNDPFPVSFRTFNITNTITELPAQSSMITQIAPTSEEDKPYQDTTIVLNGSYDSGVNHLNCLYFGESLVSIRAMLKRYCPYASAVYTSTAAVDNNLYFRFTRTLAFPVLPTGSPSSNFGSTKPMPGNMSPSTGANGVRMTYLRYYGQAYIGYRGSICWKIVGHGTNDRTTLTVKRESMSVQASGDVGTVITPSTGVTDFVNTMSIISSNMGTTGAHLVDCNLGRGINIQIPFQSKYRFAPIHQEENLSFLVSNPMLDGFTTIVSYTSGAINSQFALQYWCAAGEDFQFFFFCGCNPFVAPF